MPVLGAATLELNADSAKLEQDLGRAVGQAAAFGTAIGTVMGQAITAGVDKLTAMVNKAIETGDELNKLSQKTGMSVGALSELRVSAELSNVSIGALKTGITQLYQHLSEAGRSSGGKANSAFEAIGLDVEKLRALKPDELFRTVTAQLAKYEDGANRAAIQTAILGRSGAELSPFINELGKTTEVAKSLGITMTQGMAEASERFKDNMTISRIASEAMGLRIAQVLLPTLEKLSGYLVDNAKNTERLDNVTRAADTGLKLFATAGTIVSAVFQTLGQQVGSTFAAMALVAKGEFSEAIKTVGRNVIDTGTKIGESVAEIELIWTDAGNKALVGAEANGKKLAAPALEATKKIKAARKEADAEFQAFLKIYAIEREVDQATNEFHRKQGEETTRVTQIAIDQARELAETLEKIRYATAHGGNNGLVFDEDTAGFEKIAQQVKKTDDFAKQMGLTFSSAFEAAVLGGKKFSEVLQSLGRDIAAIILRKSVTEPLGNAVSGAISGGGLGDWLKGMLPSFAVGSDYVPRDMVAQIHEGEQIIPAGQRGGGDTYNVDFRGAPLEAVQKLQAFVLSRDAVFNERAIGAMQDWQLRGNRV